MIKFESFWPCVLILLPFLIYKLKPIQIFTKTALILPQLMDLISHDNQAVKFHKKFPALAWPVWICFILALMQPYISYEPDSHPLSGRNIILAIDISNSMTIKDMQFGQYTYDRISVVKQIAGDFIRARVGDRVGLILFGTDSYLQTPLTYDLKTAQSMLMEADPGIAGQFTAIGNAVLLATQQFENISGHNILILLTDGKDNSSVISIEKALEYANEQNITIYTIGLGSPQATESIDEFILKTISSKTSGEYYRAFDPIGLKNIYKHLDSIEPVINDEDWYCKRLELSFYFLGAALTGFLFWYATLAIRV